MAIVAACRYQWLCSIATTARLKFPFPGTSKKLLARKVHLQWERMFLANCAKDTFKNYMLWHCNMAPVLPNITCSCQCQQVLLSGSSLFGGFLAVYCGCRLIIAEAVGNHILVLVFEQTAHSKYETKICYSSSMEFKQILKRVGVWLYTYERKCWTLP